MIHLVRAAVLALTLTGSAAYVHLATSSTPSPQKTIITNSGYPTPYCPPTKEGAKNCPL